MVSVITTEAFSYYTKAHEIDLNWQSFVLSWSLVFLDFVSTIVLKDVEVMGIDDKTPARGQGCKEGEEKDHPVFIFLVQNQTMKRSILTKPNNLQNYSPTSELAFRLIVQ